MPAFAALLSALLHLLSPVGIGVLPGYHLAPDAYTSRLDGCAKPLDNYTNPL